MRAVGSILMPQARLTLWKALGLLLAAGGAEALLFFRALEGWAGSGAPTLEELLGQSRLSLVFALGLLALCALLVLPGVERGSRTGYTLRRLSLEERKITLLWGGLNALVVLLYWVGQLAVVLLLARRFLHTALPGTVTGQSLFLACYRSPYLHGLLPLEDWMVLARNLLGCAALGLSAAALPFHWRHGRRAFSTLPLAAAAAFAFPAALGRLSIHALQAVVLALVCVLTCYGVWRWHGDED